MEDRRGVVNRATLRAINRRSAVIADAARMSADERRCDVLRAVTSMCETQHTRFLRMKSNYRELF